MISSRTLTRSAAAILAALLVSGCTRTIPAEQGVGVGRDPGRRTPFSEAESDETDPNAPPLDRPGEESAETDASDAPDGKTPSDAFPDGKTWMMENGKYVYNFAPRDKSREQNVSDIASLYGVPFADSAEEGDWYPGGLTYDEATGEVTVAYDRYQSTVDTLKKYGAIYRGDETRKVIYLTFDCGYEYGPTTGILDTLKEKNAPALFFVTGQYVEESSDIIERMLDDGHIVGNHTVHHVRPNTLSAAEFIEELEELEKLFYEKIPDAQPMIYFRPPYGNCNEYVLALTQKMGYHTVMWSATYKDYDTENQWSYDDAMAKVKSMLHPGAVYLFHTESTTNAAILGGFIDWVRGEGYEILPIADISFDSENE